MISYCYSLVLLKNIYAGSERRIIGGWWFLFVAKKYLCRVVEENYWWWVALFVAKIFKQSRRGELLVVGGFVCCKNILKGLY